MFVIIGTIGTNTDDITNIKVTNMLGQAVYTTTAAAINGTVNERITLDNSLASGMYLMNITSSTGSTVFHVVIEK